MSIVNYRVKIVKIKDSRVFTRLGLCQKDITFPGTENFALQILVGIWNELRRGYANELSVGLGREKGIEIAENHPRFFEFQNWDSYLKRNGKKDFIKASREIISDLKIAEGKRSCKFDFAVIDGEILAHLLPGMEWETGSLDFY